MLTIQEKYSILGKVSCGFESFPRCFIWRCKMIPALEKHKNELRGIEMSNGDLREFSDFVWEEILVSLHFEVNYPTSSQRRK
jgi:hypothetical protein